MDTLKRADRGGARRAIAHLASPQEVPSPPNNIRMKNNHFQRHAFSLKEKTEKLFLEMDFARLEPPPKKRG